MASKTTRLPIIMAATVVIMAAAHVPAAPRDDVAQYEARRDQAEAELRDFDTLVVRPLVTRRDRVLTQYTYKTERPVVLRKQILGLERQEAGLRAEIKVFAPQIDRLRQQARAKLQSVPVESERAAELEARGLTKDAKKARERANKGRSEAKGFERKANETERKLARKESQLARKRTQLDELRDELTEIIQEEPTPEQLQAELRRLAIKLGDLDQLREEKQHEVQLWRGIVALCKDYNRLVAQEH